MMLFDKIASYHVVIEVIATVELAELAKAYIQYILDYQILFQLGGSGNVRAEFVVHTV